MKKSFRYSSLDARSGSWACYFPDAAPLSSSERVKIHFAGTLVYYKIMTFCTSSFVSNASMIYFQSNYPHLISQITFIVIAIVIVIPVQTYSKYIVSYYRLPRLRLTIPTLDVSKA